MKCLIALVAYNRPKHLELTLKNLFNALLSKPMQFDPQIIAFVDSPRSRNDIESNQSVLKLLNEFGLQVILRHENIGLRNNILEILRYFKGSEYESLIVIEDDIIAHIDSMKYFFEMFNRYRDDSQVLQISGFSPVRRSTLDVFRHSRLSTWLWGTWQSKFPEVDSFVIDWSKFEIYHWIKQNLTGLSCMPDVKDILKAQSEKRINAWSLDLLVYMINFNMRTIYPTATLALNIGHDGSGVNCGKQNYFNWNLKRKNPYFKIPEINMLEINELVDFDLINDFKKHYTPTAYSRIMRAFA